MKYYFPKETFISVECTFPVFYLHIQLYDLLYFVG